MKKLILLAAVFALSGCFEHQHESTSPIEHETMTIDPGPEAASWELDMKSYYIGAIAGFAEMVNYEVRTMALGPAIVEAEMDELYEEAEKIANRQNVKLYRDKDFLVTDLFSPEITNGKEVLIIYKGDALEKYKALKAKKKQLIEESLYSGKAREDIARGFGRLLSYPEATIDMELIR